MGTKDLIKIASPRGDFNPDYLDQPGAYAWWYVDLIDPAGRVAVLIFSFGLPFLPGYRRSVRRCPEASSPRNWAAVNLAVYENGKPSFFNLTHVSKEAAVWNAEKESWAFGNSVFRRQRDDGQFSFNAILNLKGSRGELAKAQFCVRGVPRRPAPGPMMNGPLQPHLWAPQTGPATGTLRLDVGHGEPMEIRGRAYQDQNAGALPLWDLGMRSWIWARFPHPDHEEIFYLVWPREQEAIRVIRARIDHTGDTHVEEGHKVELGPIRRTYAGMNHPQWLRVFFGDDSQKAATLHLEERLDVGPFYLRFGARRDLEGGKSVFGVAEKCIPAHVDKGWQRPFVRMRVQQDGQRNSMWLPLFTGSRTGRLGRLLGLT
jgi:hypothetical protein